MKLALIPPRGYETLALGGDAHLLLAQVNNPHYESLYKVACRQLELSILDNGANEGPPVSDQVLMSRAAFYGVKEVVVPDVLRDRGRTLRRAREFWGAIHTYTRWPTNDYDYMAVVQGRTMAEVEACLEGFSRFNFINTIGIPRHLLETLNQLTARISIARMIKQRYGSRWNIHFLGTNPIWMGEILHAADEVSFVRSVDTSAPFNYAMAGQLIRTTSNAVHRPDKYFSQKPDLLSMPLVEHNISILKGWVRGVR